MNHTEELTVVSNETLAGLDRIIRSAQVNTTRLTMATPHNSMIVESQMLGRSLFRSTLLGTYQNMVRAGRICTRGEGTCFKKRVGEVEYREA
jgi:hypothetical protein